MTSQPPHPVGATIRVERRPDAPSDPWSIDYNSSQFGGGITNLIKPSPPTHLVVVGYSESANDTIVARPTDLPIIDALGDRWTLLMIGGQVAIDGKPDPTTGTVGMLVYWNHHIYAQSLSGAWWYRSGAKDPWVATTAPHGLITRLTIIAELDALKKLISGNRAQIALAQIRADVNSLHP